MKKAPKYTLVPTYNWKAQKLNVASRKTIIYKRPERRLQRTVTVFQLHSCFLYENKSCSFPDQALNFHTIYIKKERMWLSKNKKSHLKAYSKSINR